MKFRKFNVATDINSIWNDRQTIDFAPPTYKEYPRFPRTPLPQPATLDITLSNVFKQRESAKLFTSEDFLPLSHLGDILHAGAGLVSNTNSPRRHHPSGGGLYPLEYYIFPYRVASLHQRIYHYAPSAHALEELVCMSGLPKHSDIVLEHDTSTNPAALILITGLWGRNYPKYGEFAYRLALLEAGHSAQNILLAATALSVKARPYGGVFTEKVNKMLDLERHTEDAIYSIIIGS